MSEPSPSAPGKAGPSKKPVSPARNAISLVVLIAVVVVGYFEVSAKMGYTAAASALDKRLQDEDHGLPTMPEAEKLIGKQADDAGSDYQEGPLKLTKKTYTWKGLIGSYTLAAYYTKQQEPALHHIEAGEKFQPQPPPTTPAAAGKSETQTDGLKKRQEAEAKALEKGTPKAHDEKAKTPEPKPDDKPKADADEKAKTPEPKPDDKPKAAPDEKAETPAKAG